MPATALVTTGLYSKIRHPIYLFGDLAVVGLIVAWGHLDWLILVVLDLPFTIRRARKEEAVLENASATATSSNEPRPGSETH